MKMTILIVSFHALFPLYLIGEDVRYSVVFDTTQSSAFGAGNVLSAHNRSSL